MGGREGGKGGGRRHPEAEAAGGIQTWAVIQGESVKVPQTKTETESERHSRGIGLREKKKDPELFVFSISIIP